MRVLVVDDEVVLADLIARGLRREQMAVDIAYRGDEAEELLSVNEYDVVVLDRDIPGLHGDAIATGLSARGALTRVLMLTAATSLADRVSGLELGADDYLTKPFERVTEIRDVLARAIRPDSPNDVGLTRPSDALAAKNATDDSFTGLLVGIGGVALLVGGIGVANTMVITVLERRAEVGVRRALGARRRNIRDQFLVESLLLSFLGGVAGVMIGVVVTFAIAFTHGWPPTIPLWSIVGGLAATIVIGGVSGLYPAARAARIPPTSALATV